MKNAILIISLLASVQLKAQINISEFVSYCDSMMNYGIDYPMIPGAVISITTSDSILLHKGYGYGDIQDKVRVDPDQTLFQLGSVGKVLTSIAVIQQIESGTIKLNSDVNEYLDNWQIQNSFEGSVTLLHLLTHTAGFNDKFIGYVAKNNAEVKPLGVHLADHMPSLFQAPGSEINYSNYGFALAGHLVERVTGNSFAQQIKESIFDPLSMTSATYHLPDDYLQKDIYANGHQWRDTFVEAKMYPRHAIPAGSVIATGNDMLKLTQALLKRDPLLLRKDGFDLLLNQQFSNHPTLTGYSLGMEVQNFNGQPAIAKGGQVTGFLSVLILFPEQDLGLFVSTNTETDNLLDQFFTGLNERFFPPQKVLPTEKSAKNLDEYVGHYVNQRHNHETMEEFFSLFRGHFPVHKSEAENLLVYHDGDWQEYQYLEDDVFQNVANQHTHMTFKRNEDGKLKSLYRNVNVAGIQIPASFRKLKWIERPRFLNDEYPFALLVVASYLFLPLLWFGRYFIRKRKPQFLRKTDVNSYYHIFAFIFLALFIWNIIGFFIPLIRIGEDIVLGIPDSLLSMKYFNWLMALCSLCLVLLSAHLWIKKKSNVWFRIYYTLFSLISLSYILILYRWHLLNVTV